MSVVSLNFEYVISELNILALVTRVKTLLDTVKMLKIEKQIQKGTICG